MTTSNPLSDDQRHALVAAAQAARERAYVPYSEYPVGAALLTASGQVFTGCNIEIASFGATVCGERTAAFKAVSEGEREEISRGLAAQRSPCAGRTSARPTGCWSC